MIGQTISHYKILEKLGEGGMGVVYKAQDLKLNRFVTLEFFAAHFGGDEEEKKRFTYEAKAASALDYPNICTIYEINQTPDGQLFIAMAYYEGETLKKRIERGPLKIGEALDGKPWKAPRTHLPLIRGPSWLFLNPPRVLSLLCFVERIVILPVRWIPTLETRSASQL
jgi:serine/threonine protein kinase